MEQPDGADRNATERGAVPAPPRVSIRKPLGYIASPYSSAYESVESIRYHEACLATRFLMRRGEMVYSPVVHSHKLVRSYGLPKTWDFWQAPSYAMLDRCDLMYILDIEGADASVGVQKEFARATRELRIPVWEMKPAGDGYGFRRIA